MGEVTKNKEIVDDILKKEKERSKGLESQISDFRAELLKIKSDKKQIKKKSCDLEEQVAQIRDEINKTEAKNKALLANLEDGFKAMKAKEIEIGKLNNEIVTVKSRLDASCIELETMRQNENNNIVEYLCKFCGKKYFEANELRQHIRTKHYKDQVSQTGTLNKIVATQTEEKIETSEYPCFYCDHVITSLEDLMNHKGDCPLLDVCQDKCDQCDAKFEHRIDLIDHYKANHPELSIIWCDFCQAGFETLEVLQCHIRIEHRNYLPG